MSEEELIGFQGASASPRSGSHPHGSDGVLGNSTRPLPAPHNYLPHRHILGGAFKTTFLPLTLTCPQAGSP